MNKKVVFVFSVLAVVVLSFFLGLLLTSSQKIITLETDSSAPRDFELPVVLDQEDIPDIEPKRGEYKGSTGDSLLIDIGGTTNSYKIQDADTVLSCLTPESLGADITKVAFSIKNTAVVKGELMFPQEVIFPVEVVGQFVREGSPVLYISKDISRYGGEGMYQKFIFTECGKL